MQGPNSLKSVEEGDVAHVPLSEISDWMYAESGDVYGGHTVNLLRSRMNKKERKSRDSAWGLEFGDPKTIRLAPTGKGWFRVGKLEDQEHPMSVAMSAKFNKQMKSEPALAKSTDE